MAKIPFSYSTAAKGFKASVRAAKGFKATAMTILGTIQDNGDIAFTVTGNDAAGATGLDLSAIATMTVVSSDPTVVTVDAPTGMASAVHTPTAPAPAIGKTATVTVTVTMNDGLTGPFTADWTLTIVAGPVTGVAIQPGPVTSH